MKNEVIGKVNKMGKAGQAIAKIGKVSAIRFSTLEAICDVLDCKPGDILEYQRNK